MGFFNTKIMRIKLDNTTTVYEPFLKWSKAKQLKHLRSLPHVKTDAQAEKLLGKLPKKSNSKKSNSKKSKDV